MAKQKDMQIIGTYDDIIFYKSKGVHLFRKKGNTGKQAPIAKQQAAIMGRASGISAKLRGPLKPLIPETAGRRLMYRLNNSLQQWLRTKPEEITEQVDNIPLLNGFAFEEHNAIIEMFHAALPVISTDDRSLFIRIPAFDSPNPINPLPFSGRIDIKAIAVSCNLQNPADTISHQAGFAIDYDGTPVPAQELKLEIKPRAGYLTVVAVSINDMVAGIVRAMYN